MTGSLAAVLRTLPEPALSHAAGAGAELLAALPGAALPERSACCGRDGAGWGADLRWIVGERAEVVPEQRTGRREPVAGELGQRVAAELGRKYGERGYAPSADAWSGPDAGGLRVFTPHKAMVWFAFPGDVTRFHFS